MQPFKKQVDPQSLPSSECVQDGQTKRMIFVQAFW